MTADVQWKGPGHELLSHPDFLALWDTCLDNPKDEAPRLILADWIEDRHPDHPLALGLRKMQGWRSAGQAGWVDYGNTYDQDRFGVVTHQSGNFAYRMNQKTT